MPEECHGVPVLFIHIDFRYTQSIDGITLRPARMGKKYLQFAPCNTDETDGFSQSPTRTEKVPPGKCR